MKLLQLHFQCGLHSQCLHQFFIFFLFWNHASVANNAPRYCLTWQVLGRRSLWGWVYSNGNLSLSAYVLIQGWVNNPGVPPVGTLLILGAAPVLWHHKPVNFSVCVGKLQLRCVWLHHCCNPTTQWPMAFGPFLCMVFKIHLNDYKAESTSFFTVWHFTLPYCCVEMMAVEALIVVWWPLFGKIAFCIPHHHLLAHSFGCPKICLPWMFQRCQLWKVCTFSISLLLPFVLLK